MENTILFEDNHLIALLKKPGDISQGDKTGNTPITEKLKAHLKLKYNKPGNVYLGLIHRLDRPVSGVMLFAKTSKASARMSEIIKTRSFKKIYWAAVKNSPPKKEDTLENYLWKDEKKNKSFIVSENRIGAKKAVLHYKHIASSDTYHLLEIELETGRHHQIRVQLAHIGCAVKGDLKYGFPRSNPDGSIHLHAYNISFNHPITKEAIVIKVSPYDDPVWNALISNIGI